MSDTLSLIRASFLNARKSRHAETSAFLGTLIGDIEGRATVGQDGAKTVSEESVIAVLKIFDKKADEFLAITDSEKVRNEKALLQSFLPEQLTAEQIYLILETTTLDRNMGAAMKYLKDNYAGEYDGKIASQVVKEWLAA